MNAGHEESEYGYKQIKLRIHINVKFLHSTA